MFPSSSGFELRVPFEVPPGHGFGSTGPSSVTSYEGLNVSLEQASNGYALKVAGFPSSETAAEFLPRVWTGLTHLMVQRESAFSASMSPRPVTYVDDPTKNFLPELGGRPIEGVAVGSEPAIYPLQKNVAFANVGRVTVSITLPADNALASILEGFDAQDAAQLFESELFRTAVSLYASAAFEESKTAKLLTLSMALEVLAPITYKHPAALDLIGTWASSVEEAKARYSDDEDALASFESLQRELIFRKQSSIRSRIRHFVFQELGANNHSRERAREAVAAYDSRSTLLHDGKLESARLTQSIEKLHTIIREILAARLSVRGTAK